MQPMPPLDPWLDALKLYGLPGLLLIGFLTGRVVAKPTYDREVLRADSYEKLAKDALALNTTVARMVKS